MPAQTMQALVRAFRRATTLSWLWCARWVTFSQGSLTRRLPLAVAETYARRRSGAQRRLRVAIASLQLSLAARGDRPASSSRPGSCLPVTVQSRDIASQHLRAVALVTWGRRAWSWSRQTRRTPNATCGSADLARQIGRPYLEVAACAARFRIAGPALVRTTQQRSARRSPRRRHGWARTVDRPR